LLIRYVCIKGTVPTPLPGQFWIIVGRGLFYVQEVILSGTRIKWKGDVETSPGNT